MSANLFNRGTIRGEFRRALDAEADKLGVNLLAKRVSSSVAIERYVIGSTPAMPNEKRGGETRVKPFSGEKFDVENLPYDTAVQVPREDGDRDQTGQWLDQVSMMGVRFAQHPAFLMDELIKAGESGTTVYNGQFLFDTAHTSGESGAQSNLLTASEVGKLNVADTAGVTPEEAADIMVQVAAYMTGYLDDSGQPMNETARSFAVKVPTEMAGAFITAANANNLDGGETNPVVAMKADGYSFRILPSPRFTSATELYIARVDHPTLRPFVLQDEQAPQVDVLGPESEYARVHDHYLVKGYYRGAVAPAEPLTITKCTVS